MSHWYDYPPVKKKLDSVRKLTGYRYEHRGEALTVFDRDGCLTVLTSLERGMDFVRVVKSMEKFYEGIITERMSDMLST